MKEIIGIITILLAFIGYIPYIIDTYKKKTSPHIFTWFMVIIIVGIVFFGQVTEQGGAGAWSTGATGVLAIVITILALRNKESLSHIKKIDVLFFTGSLICLIPWYITKEPLLSVILATVMDVCALLPTLRKTIKNPNSETFSLYGLNILRHFLSLLALSTYNLTTVLYPLYLLVVNILMSFIILKGKGVKS